MRLKLYTRSCRTLQQTRRRLSQGLPSPVYQGKLRLRANLRNGTFLKRVAMMQDVIGDQRRQLKEEMHAKGKLYLENEDLKVLARDLIRDVRDALSVPGNLLILEGSCWKLTTYLDALETPHDPAR